MSTRPPPPASAQVTSTTWTARLVVLLALAGTLTAVRPHFLTDLLLRIDALPAREHWTAMVGGDTVLLFYGLVLLRPWYTARTRILNARRPGGASARCARPATPTR
jgi:hypothetical protein